MTASSAVRGTEGYAEAGPDLARIPFAERGILPMMNCLSTNTIYTGVTRSRPGGRPAHAADRHPIVTVRGLRR